MLVHLGPGRSAVEHSSGATLHSPGFGWMPLAPEFIFQ